MKQLNPGDPAPAFSLPDATGKLVSLRDYAGGNIIVYFYPAALTPACTVEAVDFSSRTEDFTQQGYSIIGISPDGKERLSEFISQNSLTVTLLSDPDRATINAYGAWGTRVIWGKPVEGVIRSTFIIAVDSGGNGTVLDAQYKVRATGHVDRLFTDLSTSPGLF